MLHFAAAHNILHRADHYYDDYESTSLRRMQNIIHLHVWLRVRTHNNALMHKHVGIAQRIDLHIRNAVPKVYTLISEVEYVTLACLMRCARM